MIIEVENNKYKIVKDYRDGFDKDLFLEKYTNYFENYDYIVGDIAYSKLRLKGFNKKTNKFFNKLNDYNNVEKYLKENCAYDCRYFILEKVTEKEQK
ncbi:MAG: YutD family protein [Bacilli bacterium]|nr:YutD family protein [Clostridia bacterium]MBR4178959.1 YutD family protein [Bacilli bacterium]